MPIMDEDIYTSKEYLICAIGKEISGTKRYMTADKIHKILTRQGIETNLSPIWDYSFYDVGSAIENDIPIVCVLVADNDKDSKHKIKKRWFELPDGFSFK